MHKIIKTCLICLFVVMTAELAGQKNVSSPYARYGIGNLELQGTFKTFAMGGISSGIRDNLALNYVTPASYSSIDTASFLFDFGIDYAVIRLKDREQGYYSQDLGFSHLLLGFPVMKGWGLAAGIVPYSDGYYEIAEVTTPDQGTEVAGDVYEYHKGTGGYQKVFAGTAFSFSRFLSAGINGFIVFGDINRNNDYVFTSDANNFNTRKNGTTAIRGFGYEASAQVMIPLSEKRFINVGATFSPSFSITTNSEELIMRYSTVRTSLYAFDTLYSGQAEETGRLPYSFRGGIAFSNKDKLTVGADVIYSGWSGATLPGSYGTYANTFSLHAGAEYIPDRYSNYSFLNRVEYRIGCRYGSGYAIYDGDQLNEYGITFGAGIPLRRSFSRVSLFVDLSARGNTDGNHFRETRVSAGASLNLFDFWFLKAKYE